MSPTTYRLVVKSPDDRVPAYSVVCLPSWCVRNLKEHIAEVYPSHPLPSNQRLINAGKLLKDDVLIKTLFKDVCTSYNKCIFFSLKRYKQFTWFVGHQIHPVKLKSPANLLCKSSLSCTHLRNSWFGLTMPPQTCDLFKTCKFFFKYHLLAMISGL